MKLIPFNLEGVRCADCNELPEAIARPCEDNQTYYRLECRCGGKGREWRRSEMMAVALWESAETALDFTDLESGFDGVPDQFEKLFTRQGKPTE